MAEGEARRRRPGWLGYIVRAVLVVVITWALYRALDLDLAELSRTDLAEWWPASIPLIASALALISVYLLHALLWRRILVDLIGQRLGVGSALRIYFLANLGRYLPGRVWQVAGMAVLARRAGVSAVAAIAASALAQFNFLLTGALFLTVLTPLLFGAGPALIAGGLFITLLGVIFWGARTESGVRVRRRVGERAGPRIGALLEAVGEMRLRDAGVWFVGYALSWVLLGGAFALFTIAFVPEAVREMRYLAGTMAAGYLSGYLAIFAPAGVGVREGVLSLLLTTVIPAPAALIVSIASRIWFTITELIVLMVIPFLRTQNGSEQMTMSESDVLREAP